MLNALKKPEVVLVLPVYASDVSFVAAINKNCAALVAAMPSVQWNVIIVNDGSPEVPADDLLLEQLQAKVNFQYYHYAENKGKGFAVRFGFSRMPAADAFIYTDYDFPFGVQRIIDTVSILLHNDIAVVAGQRGENYFSALPVLRKIITTGIRALNKYLLRLHCYDTQAGIKGMNKNGLAVLEQTALNGFLFDLQFIRNAQRQQYRMHRLAVDSNPQLVFNNFSLTLIFKEIKSLLFLLAAKNKPPGMVPVYGVHILNDPPEWRTPAMNIEQKHLQEAG